MVESNDRRPEDVTMEARAADGTMAQNNKSDPTLSSNMPSSQLRGDLGQSSSSTASPSDSRRHGPDGKARYPDVALVTEDDGVVNVAGLQL